MKKIILLLLVLTVLFGFGARDSRAENDFPRSKAELSAGFAPLVKRVTPAVVNIYAAKLVQQRVSPLFGDPFFRQFFGDMLPRGMTRERLEHSLGSGVIVRSDGLIVTSRHVIVDATEIRVVLSDRREFDAEIVMSDERSDLALLRIDAKKRTTLPFVELRNSDEAEVGDLVLAIGNPFGVGQTVTMGIISALAHRALGATDLGQFIQTDAAINPGNSGGALITTDGKLIGINAAIYSRDGGNMGIGFAIPSNMVRVMMAAADQGKKKLTHPWVGVEGQEVSQDIALSLSMDKPFGYLVSGVHPMSPAGKAGIKPGDVIVSVNGRTIEDADAFRYRTTALSEGDKAEFGLMRKGKMLTVTVPMIAPPEMPPRDTTTIEGSNPLSGAVLANLSPALAEELGFTEASEGVIVTEIAARSIVFRMGIRPGDIIVSINGKRVESAHHAERLLDRKAKGWRITLRRKGKDMNLSVGH